MAESGQHQEPGRRRGVEPPRPSSAGGSASAHDVVDAVLARRERDAAGPPDHVWISVVAERELRKRADELVAIRRERGPDLAELPLYGVPFAVKDNIHVQGMPTTAGCPAWARRPASTAHAVHRLLQAGALLVGKTNLDQFATGLTGTRSPYGSCESVFGGGLISGGSSSGSAVAVAAGMVDFALGTDTAGSGRVPAALNGIVGLKPTRGLVSTGGVVPACRSLDCVSVFAPTVTGAARVLDVLASYDDADPWSRHRPAGGGPVVPVAALRLGVPDAGLDFFGDEPMRRAYELARDEVVAATGTVVPVDLAPLLEAGDLLYHGPWLAERLVDLDEFLRAYPGEVHPVTRAVLEAGRRFDAVSVFRAEHRLAELRRQAARLWDRIDVLVLPTIGTTFTLAEIDEQPVERNWQLGRYTQFANLLDLAVVAVPAGRTADDRPLGLSLAGPAFSEPVLTALGAVVASSGGGEP